MDPAITVKDLLHQFPKTAKPAIDRISTTISSGRITGLVGPDGAGKSTLMRLIAGLLKPSAGEIQVLGLDPIRDAKSLRGLIGYMPQKFGLYEDLSVQENLDLHADLRELIGQERQDTFARLLKFTDLARFTDRLAGNLSGGMKQKLGLACALLGTPRVLLLDEPGVGVDPISRRELWRMVRELTTDGIAIVWSTAYLDEAERCDEIILLNDGVPLYTGTPASLSERMAHRCFLLPVADATERRKLLTEYATAPEILDATIQAENLRLIYRKPSTDSASGINSSPSRATALKAKETAPRFEDAFLDILSEKSVENAITVSPLSRILREIPRDNSTVIETRDLTRKFGNFVAADHITLQVKRGEIYGLLGPNGAGKSTTFRMLCGLLAPTSGEAHAAGIDLRHSPAQARQRIGYMAQKFSLYGGLTIGQNLAFFSGAYGLHGKAQDDAIKAVTDCFHLGPVFDSRAETLPLGHKQRLALACAVMHGPDILFLDEPTSGVDPVARREFWAHINAAVQRGVTVMVTTHFMDEAEYCDRIGLVYRGRFIANGTPEELKQQAATTALPHPTMEDAFIALIEKSGL